MKKHRPNRKNEGVRKIVKITACFFWITFLSSCEPNTFKIDKYYPIADKNEWRYGAPEGWKDGDYISKIEEVNDDFAFLFEANGNELVKDKFTFDKNTRTFLHYDATKAAKLLTVNKKGIQYHGDTFSSDSSVAVFDKPIEWFNSEEYVGSTLKVKRNYTRFYRDGTSRKGVFTLEQKIEKKEDVNTTIANFKDCLRIAFNTYWDLGDGMEAKSINVYHHARNIGVVKASARFIITKNGIEIINRLVEPKLKSYQVNNSIGSSKNLSGNVSLPNMERIKMATVVSQDIKSTITLYRNWLKYNLVEEGILDSVITKSWGTPKMLGKPYALLQSKSGDDVYLRVVQGTVPENYKAMTTFGWNAIEIIVDNPDSVYTSLANSAFVHLDGPSNLGDELSTIRAVQFKGPSEEVFYFTTDTGDRSKSTLLTPRVAIDRPFIMVVAGPNARTLTDFYKSTFGTNEAFYIKTPISLVASAQDMPTDYKFNLGLVRLGAFSNSIEIDGYSENATKRYVAEGELPPGVSIATFTVKNLDLIDSKLFVSVPTKHSGIAYKGNRTGTIIGPAGEMIELIEEK